jgi:hypothetical protein
MEEMSTASGSRQDVPVARRPGALRAQEHEWRHQHAHELQQFAGEWIVLEGDRIVSHGAEAAAVVARARAEGVPVPYVFFVEPDEGVDVHIGP